MVSAYEPVTTHDTDDEPELSEKVYDDSFEPPIYLYRRLLLLIASTLLLALGFYIFKLSHQPPPPSPSSGELAETEMPGKYSVGYFVNWGIYGRKFPPSSIPVNDLTHILYAFANISSETGAVSLSDTWADTDIHYPGDSWNDSGDNLYGNFKAIYLLKKKHRHLKVLLSIGGWTYSPSMHPVVVDPAKRRRFVETSVRMVEDFGLDGLDVDYEYPRDDNEAKGYVSLLKELRIALDELQKGRNYKFLLTIAAPCGPDNYRKLHVKDMNKYLDAWNLMAYDFAGSWDKVANHQSNLFPSSTTSLAASVAVEYYIKAGVAPHKIILGIPLYGRSFMQTEGPGTPFNGIGAGSWENGVYDYRSLPRPHSHNMRDEKAKASWCYDYEKHEMVSFDSEEVGRWKGEWIKQINLGGSMFWELSGDKEGPDREIGGEGKEHIPGKSLVKVVKHAMGGLEMNEHNWLEYPGSKYDNMKKGME